MATYTIYLPPEEQLVKPLDGCKALHDGKSTWALVFPPFWLIWHRLWLELLIYAIVMFVISLIAFWQPGAAIAYLSAVPGLYLLLEGSELVRKKHERNGWRYAGVVEGDTQEEAEIRFLVNHEPELIAKQATSKPQPVVSRVPFHVPDVNPGLFPQ